MKGKEINNPATDNKYTIFHALFDALKKKETEENKSYSSISDWRVRGDFLVTQVVMPRLRVKMKAGTITQWYKKDYETVLEGEPVAKVEFERTSCEIEASATGTIRILAKEGTEKPVGETLAFIGGYALLRT